MSEKYIKEFREEAERIYSNFFGKGETRSKNWAYEKGLLHDAQDCLDRMLKARSKSQFDEAKYEFNRRFVTPFYKEVVAPMGEDERISFIHDNPVINFRSTKPLGSYDDIKKNDKVLASPYVVRKKNRNGEDEVFVPLLRMVNDPGELSRIADALNVTPQELREHVESEWEKKQSEARRSDYLKMLQKIQANRRKFADEFEKSFVGKIGQFVAPEVMATGLDEMVSGDNKPTWDYVKAASKDAAVDIASAVVPLGVGKFAKNPIVQNVVGGAIDAGIEAGRQAMSNYYDMDWDNIKQTGQTSATVPTIVGGVGAALSTIPGMRRYLRPFMKKVYNPSDIPVEKMPPAPKTRLGKFAERAAEDFVDFAGRKEVMGQRSNGPKMNVVVPSTALQFVMENDQNMIRMWERGFVPSNPELKTLYNEWNKLYGGEEEQ